MMGVTPVSEQACDLRESPCTKQFKCLETGDWGPRNTEQAQSAPPGRGLRRKERMNDLHCVPLLNSTPPCFHPILNTLSQILL